MKPRRVLSAGEVVDLYKGLQERLDGIGLQSQPEVAVKLLQLSSRPNAQLTDYANLIKNDQAVAGRVLRLANSAFFAQRKPVTTIDRACVVLGVDRLKAVSLGFHLSKAAQAPGDKDYSRKVWGESLYRACLASQFARLVAPGVVSEAFVVGLMMDAGLPLMGKLAGENFRAIVAQPVPPGRQHRQEFDTLPFTHVDVVVALMMRWKLPELLIKPVEMHHAKPPEIRRDDPISRLHRIAYVIGLIDLSALGQQPAQASAVTSDTPGVLTSQRVLGISEGEVAHAIRQSGSEYSAISDMFSDVATGLGNIDDLMERVQMTLVSAVDEVIEQDLVQERAQQPARIIVGGHMLEIVRESDGSNFVYLYDSQGKRMLSHRFFPGHSTPGDVCEALGIDCPPVPDVERLGQSMARLAA